MKLVYGDQTVKATVCISQYSSMNEYLLTFSVFKNSPTAWEVNIWGQDLYIYMCTLAYMHTHIPQINGYSPN